MRSVILIDEGLEVIDDGRQLADLGRTTHMIEKNRILVVDDESSFRATLSTLLKEQGYSVSSAADGDIAIEMLRSQYYDLILLDLKMPNVDGFDVLKFAKENNPTTKVVMLTAFADLKNAIESRRRGAEDLVAKGVDFADLLSTVERTLNAPSPGESKS